MNCDELKEVRERLNYTAQEMADALDVSLATYYNYERGYRHLEGGGQVEVGIPKVVALACIAIQLGVSDYNGEELDFE